MTANVRPKGPIRSRAGLLIREGGVDRMDRHTRWLINNGSLEVMPEEPTETVKQKASKPKENADD